MNCTTIPPVVPIGPTVVGAHMYDPWLMRACGWTMAAAKKPELGSALPQWLALCALKTACSLPIRVVGAGFAKPKPLKMHCGQAVGAEPPGVELKVFTVCCPPK